MLAPPVISESNVSERSDTNHKEEDLPVNPAEVALLYNQGFRNPSAGFPAFRRASFRRAMTEANTGHAAEVPPERVS